MSSRASHWLLEVSCSFTSEQVCQVLERLVSARGKPSALRTDNGPEFVALALKGFCYRHGINAAYIEPGKPWQNGFAESFVSRLRDELLEGTELWSVLHAKTVLSSWRRYYNEERLHSRIGYQTPRAFAADWLEPAEKRPGLRGLWYYLRGPFQFHRLTLSAFRCFFWRSRRFHYRKLEFILDFIAGVFVTFLRRRL